jgi:hypothetical protein
LLLTRLLRLLQLHLRLGPASGLVVGRLGGAGLDTLPVLQLLLPLLLIELQSIRRPALPLLLIDLRQVGRLLLLTHVRGRGSRTALLLLHSQLQGILLLLALQLMLLERAHGGILRPPGWRNQRGQCNKGRESPHGRLRSLH